MTGYVKPITPKRLPQLSTSMASYGLNRRGFKILGTLLFAIGMLLCVRWHSFLQAFLGPRLPPLYQKVREREQSLSHYKEYEQMNVKYFFAANHVAHSLGWGNVMQDLVMMGLLAHTTNRSFVFDDYVWNDGSLYSEYNGKLIPSRIPLSALLGGPLVGGPWPLYDDTPLSVSKEFFHKVCPRPTVLRVSDINTNEMRFSDDVPAAFVFEKWIETINSVGDPCLMIDSESDQIFEIWILGNKRRMLTIWPYLEKSPVSVHWGWSPFVYDAYRRNQHLFDPTSTQNLSSIFTQRGTMPSPISGLLAMHIRRGDFKDHCQYLSKWSAEWNAFNSFPEFRDKFELPSGGGGGETSEENTKMYVRHCYPSIEQIVEKVREVRVQATDPLQYLYIMTNGQKPWVEELKSALARDMSWDQISSSRDLQITWEQKFIVQCLDMYVAQRAQVFIGNGWSSLTSNVVMLRMTQQLGPETNRFW